jgi:hypothetical protein
MVTALGATNYHHVEKIIAIAITLARTTCLDIINTVDVDVCKPRWFRCCCWTYHSICMCLLISQHRHI